MPVKNPTQWQAPSGTGFIITTGTNFLTDNLGNFLTDNLGNFLVTTPTYAVPKYTTLWTESGA